MRILLIIIATLFLLGSTVSFATIPSTKSRQQPKIGGLFAVSRRQALFSGAAGCLVTAAAASPSHAATVRIKDFPGLAHSDYVFHLVWMVRKLSDSFPNAPSPLWREDQNRKSQSMLYPELFCFLCGEEELSLES
jgi:hypothetical protein